MANRGYNGTIIVLIKDEKYKALVQAGETYSLHTTEEMYDSLDTLLETAVETDDFIQWYDRFLIEEKTL